MVSWQDVSETVGLCDLISPSTINGAVSALRFLFDVTLKRRDLSRALVITRYQRQLPDVLSIEEAARLLEAAPGIKYKAALGVAYAKAPFAGPEAVLAYLSRYTHRVAISNSRLLRFDGKGVTFRYKDYRRADANRQQVMTLAANEFVRRFLIHVLPRGFHRIRHYGLLAGSARKDCLALARNMLGVVPAPDEPAVEQATPDLRPPCPCCGGTMVIIETFAAWCQPRAPPTARPPNRETINDPA